MALGPIPSLRQFWKDVPILTTCGVCHWHLAICFRRICSFQTVYKSDSPISPTRNPHFILVCHTPCLGPGVQSFQKKNSTQQRQVGASWTGPSVLAWTSEPAHLGPNPSFCLSCWISMPRTCAHPRVATSIELPVCLSIFPSPERAFEEICHEHQCPSLACYTLETQIHTSSRQRYPFLRTVPKPSWALHHPRFGSNTKARFETTKMLIRHIRYVDNRLIFGDKRLQYLYRARSRIPWFHAWSQTARTDLLWTHQHISSPVSIFCISTKSASQWFPLPLPHRGKRSIPLNN